MKVGLALAGGGVKGSYQIGSYYAFKKMHIKFNGIVGTSIGALNGAVILSGNYKNLMEMWKEIDPGVLMEIDPELIKYLNDKSLKFKTIMGVIRTSRDVLKNRGLPLDNIRNLVSPYIDVNKILKSNADFGLATYNFTKHKPVYKYKEDIPNDKFIDYVMASCSLPVFKLDRKIDDDLYLDGAFYDNCPSNMLVDKNYDIIYEVKINGFGKLQKSKAIDTKIITISPSRNNGNILEMNHNKIVDNIYMGYYDTLKKLGKYDGIIYTFKKIHFLNVKKLEKIDKYTLNRVKNFFNEKDSKKLLVKVIEYIMKKENYDYNKVYNFKKILKKEFIDGNFVYKFIKKYQNL